MQKFEKGFFVGAATAAHQVEGNNIHSDYWAQEQLPHTSFTEPSGIACDHYNKYEEDIKLLADAGLNAYRFSIEWARIEPEEGKFDPAEIEHYRKVIACCKAHGVEPVVTLLHFTSPKWLIAKGGWEAESTVEYFKRYVSYVMEQLGSELHIVCTINEANMGLQLAAISKRFRLMAEQAAKAAANAGKSAEGSVQVGMNFQKMMENFAFNDQDNYRQNNICTWLNEQSAREIYLKAFEQPIKAGGMGVMTSMNAVGPVWAGGCKALLTNILRDEWGFHGAVITDAVVSAWYMDGNLAIRTGGTKMLAFNITNEFYRDLNSVGTVTAMRNAAHGTLYALANSFAVTRAVAVPKWVKTTYAVDAVVAIILVAWEICAIRKYRKAKKEDEDTEQ